MSERQNKDEHTWQYSDQIKQNETLLNPQGQLSHWSNTVQLLYCVVLGFLFVQREESELNREILVMF